MKGCADSHPTLHDEMYHECRLDKRMDSTFVAGGYADGPLAWRLYLKSLFPTETRTRSDRGFYELSLELQKKNPLPPDASAAAYRQRANRFITDINPAATFRGILKGVGDSTDRGTGCVEQ